MRAGNTIVVIRSVIAALFVALAVANFVGGAASSASCSPRWR